MKALFSCAVWKRPWPNLEVVSMNLSSIFSRARRLWCTRRDWGSKRDIKDGEPQLPPPYPHSTPRRTQSITCPYQTPSFTLPPPQPAAEQATGQNRLLDGAHDPACRAALTFLSVITRFLVPAMQPFNMTKSLFTSP